MASSKTNPSKTSYTYGLNDFANMYKKRKYKKEITKKQYKDFMKDFLKLLSKKIYGERWTLYMPNKLGYLAIITKKLRLNSLPTDYHNSAKLKKRVYLINNHSEQRISRIKWFKQFCNIPHKKYYEFKPQRQDKNNPIYKEGLGKRALYLALKNK